jgi:tetratricopeptide (TPR) repeat protein/predicted Ser/Thr protein kinase
MTVDGIPLVGPPPEDFETRKLRARAAVALFGDQAPDVMKIGRFLLLSPLGMGGQGAVFKAHDEELDRPVALKRLTLADPESKARMRREGQALAKVTHPNVVQIYEVGEDETGRPFLVMALVEGQPLDEWLRESRRHWVKVVELMCAVGDGLAAIHAQGLIHRDVKPKNIVIDKDGTPKLVDLGIAMVGETTSRASEGSTKSQARAGTAGYMAPEHYEGRTDQRSDQFGLCVTLYEALHGLRPPWSMTRSQPPPLGDDPGGKTPHGQSFANEPSDIASVTVPERRFLVEGLEKLPGGLLAILVRGLQHDPEDRYQDMAALVGALRGILPRPRRGRPLTALAGLVVAGGTAIWATTAPQEPCEDRHPAQRLWSDGSKRTVLDAFTQADPANAQQTFSAVDEMLTTTTTSLDARWSEACDSQDDANARQLSLTAVQSDRAAFATIVEGLGTVDVSQIVEIPIRLAGPLGRLQAPGSPDLCDRTETILSPTLGLEHIEGLRRRAVAEGIAGRYDTAHALGVEALGLAKDETLGPVRARLHLDLGRLALEGLRFEEAIPALDAARSQAETLGCDRLGAEALALAAKAQLLAPRGSNARADQASQLALEKLDRIGAEGPPRAEALKSRGLYLQQARDYEGALDHYRRALQIWDMQDPQTKSDQLGVADTLLNVGVTQALQGDPAAAIATLDDAISIREHVLWPEHPSMYKLHASLSYRYMEMGDLPASRRSLSHAIALATEGLGSDNPRLSMLHMAMARLLDRQHEFEAALQHATKADEVLVANYGENGRERLDGLNTIGQVCMDARWYDRAIAALRKALEILASSEVSSAEDIATTRGLLARAYTLKGDVEAAEPLFIAAHQTFAADPLLQANPFFPELLLGWGQNLVARGKHAAAVRLLNQAVTLWEERGDNPERLAHARWWLARASCPSDEGRARQSAREALRYYRTMDTQAAEQMRSTIDAWLESACRELPTSTKE